MIAGIHRREYTLAETMELLEAMGYKVIRKYYWDIPDVQIEYSLKGLVKFLVFQVARWKRFLMAIGRKKERPVYDFRFTDATR